MRSLSSRKSQRQQRLDLSRVIFHGSSQGSRPMSLNVTNHQSEGDRQTSVQMTNGSKSEFFSEFSRDRGGDRRPVGGEQLVQVEEVEEWSGVEWHSGARLTCAPRAPKDSFDQPEDLLLSVRRVEDPRKQTYNIFPFRASRTTHIYMLGNEKNCV